VSDWSHEWGDTPCGRCTGTRGLHAKGCTTQAPKRPTPLVAARFRKRPIVVDAVQYELGKGLEDAWGYRHSSGTLGMVWTGHPVRPAMPDPRIHGPLVPVILTKEGAMEISPGDWIITGVEGERYPCKPSIFAATYEAV
jgi:hypothetical protein